MQQSKGVIVDGEIQDSPEMEVEKKKLVIPQPVTLVNYLLIFYYMIFFLCVYCKKLQSYTQQLYNFF